MDPNIINYFAFLNTIRTHFYASIFVIFNNQRKCVIVKLLFGVIN